MAQLTSPPINFAGPLEPTSQSFVVPSAQIATAGLAVYTGGILSSPASNQLVPPPPTPESGMYVWQRTIVDQAGEILTDARVEVRHSETNALALIFEDRDGDIPKSNPFFVDAEGFARFYALAGLYDITASRAGLERVWENVLLGVRLVDLPDLTSVITPIAQELVQDAIDAFEAGLVIPEGYIVAGVGSVSDSGAAVNLPAGWSSVLASPTYTVTHGLALAPGSYFVFLSPSTGAGGHINPQPTAYNANSFSYQVKNDENGNILQPVRFVLLLDQQFGT